MAGTAAAADHTAAATGLAAASLVAKEVSVVHGQESFKLCLLDGAEPSSLVAAVDGRLNLGGASFHLTLPGSEAVLPLTTALPDGLTVHVHARHRPGEAVAKNSAVFPVNVFRHDARRATSAASDAPPLGAFTTAAAPLLGDTGGNEDSNRRGVKFGPVTPAKQRENSFVSEGDSIAAVSMASEIIERNTAQIEQAAQSIDRFSRLSTDLANERTLLAWMRTGMAAMRTAFSFLAITAEGVWLGSVIASRMAMVTVVLAASFSGIMRYRRVKQATFMAMPPQHFGRISIHWFNLFMGLTTIALLLGMYSMAWEKA